MCRCDMRALADIYRLDMGAAMAQINRILSNVSINPASADYTRVYCTLYMAICAFSKGISALNMTSLPIAAVQIRSAHVTIRCHHDARLHLFTQVIAQARMEQFGRVHSRSYIMTACP
jgi:hypothetical protein